MCPWLICSAVVRMLDPAIDSAKAQAAARQMSFLSEEEMWESRRRRLVLLIHRVHRMMDLWGAGEIVKMDEYLDSGPCSVTIPFTRFCRRSLTFQMRGVRSVPFLKALATILKGKGYF